MVPSVSVIIPAHNEASVIGRCLSALAEGAPRGALETIVVCNGCNDETAEIASRFDAVKVVELSQASKIAALNAGDEHRSNAIVAYVDADVVLSGGDLLQAASQLGRNGIKIVAPKLEVDLARSNFLVRAFYTVWMKLPYFSDRRTVGSGVYILSEEGRARFGSFPPVIADDGYVRALFTADEMRTVEDATFRIFAPRDLKNLIKIKTRVRLGNAEVKARFPRLKAGGENKPKAFLALLAKQPWLVPAGAVYAYVQWRTAVEARRRLAASEFDHWERDETSRAS